MSIAGVEGLDPMRAATAATTSASGVGSARPPAPVEPPAPVAPRQGRTSRFENPELTSGLLSDNITSVQRDGLGRLSRLLRMQPRELLDNLRGGVGLGMLLAARRLGATSLLGMFDKGLLIDAQA